MFEEGVKVTLLLLVINGFQALLRFLGLVGGVLSINDTHVVNNIRTIFAEVSDDEITLQLYLVL